MTREEAIRCLEICKKYIDKIRASEGVEVSKELCMALDMAIKSLEQKPIDSVLDKIRADMVAKVCHFLRLKNMQRVHGLEDAFEIIDKYKTESEAAEL